MDYGIKGMRQEGRNVGYYTIILNPYSYLLIVFNFFWGGIKKKRGIVRKTVNEHVLCYSIRHRLLPISRKKVFLLSKNSDWESTRAPIFVCGGTKGP